MQQPAEGRTIGISDQYGEWGEADVGFIQRSDDYRYSIASENGSGEDYDWDIQGIVTNSRIEDMVANNEKSRFQGAKTGRSHSEVFRYDNVNWESTDGPVVFIDHDSDGGDSGCPYFELDDDGAYIMGVHAWGHNDETQAKGNTIEFAENVLDVVV
ncbi:hypothetical protein AMS69_13825 [Haloarcula rubripromontorii]|uniref:Peptidase S1 domain-containing protein n=2 Tax=Haloarcula rubripromontorii TaxID=1705562 RepID=A0A0M9AI27_9EURY|nr:hypothetical protein AMS69_13825 [Haloarcula rubripromontorii]